MADTFAKVSTLFIMVGFSHKPFSAGKGGRERGIPLLPSMEAIRAVSSPQTNAPAPSLIFTLKEKLLPKIESPNNPTSSICLMAIFNRVIANGYSART